MRTGTRTVRAPPLTTLPPARMSGRLFLTASRTFSLWRNQSRDPRENRSYQPVISGVCASSGAPFIPVLLLREQRRHVVERFLGAVSVVAVFADQPFLHHRDLVARVIVRARARGDQAQHLAPLLEQVLLDGLVQTDVARERELLADLEGHHR